MERAERLPQVTRSSSTAQSDFALFEQLYPVLRRFAGVVADQDMDPDDLVQDALAATLARHPLHELDEPAAYLKRAVVNVASNKRRASGRLRRLLPKISRENTTSDHYPSDLAVLDELAPLDRAVIYLTELDGWPHDVVAAELGLTTAAVSKRASRARNQLRQSLGTNITSLPRGQE